MKASPFKVRLRPYVKISSTTAVLLVSSRFAPHENDTRVYPISGAVGEPWRQSQRPRGGWAGVVARSATLCGTQASRQPSARQVGARLQLVRHFTRAWQACVWMEAFLQLAQQYAFLVCLGCLSFI